MSYWKIAWRNLTARALASSLTALSMALGVALISLVLVIHDTVVTQLSHDAQGYNFIIGSGQGSKFEVVLSTVFHFGTPLYPVPYRHYREFVDGKFAKFVDVAVPICLGDSFAAADGTRFRVIATTPDMFDKLCYGADSTGADLRYRFAQGRNFQQEHFFEAVLGSVAANRTGLKVGDRFRPSHGLGAGGAKHDEFEIVGVLAPTGTTADRGLFVNVEGFYLLEGHALSPKQEPQEPAAGGGSETADADAASPGDGAGREGSQLESHAAEAAAGRPRPLPEAQREVTSILLRCPPDDMMAPMNIERGVNKGEDRSIQAVAPVSVVERLQAMFIDPMRLILLVLTVLIVIVASIGVLVSIYNSMNERSHDIAVMRALGASRVAVMLIVLAESVLLAVLGAAGGLLLGHLALAAAGPWIEFYAGVTIPPWRISSWEWLLGPALVVLAAAAGLLPALTAYRTDVAKTLGGAR